MAEERAQRRLAAILAADVVGYSRLMGRDESGTLAVLKTRRRDVLQPAIVRHRGRIVKVMGDGVLIEFASAVDAVECAVVLQEGMESANAGLSEDRRIVLRVGINLGDVIVEGSDLYGDGVNIAARLEALAEPGSVLISGKVRQEIANKLGLTFDDLGEKNLKNIAETVRVYRVSVSVTPAGGVILGKTVEGSKPSIAVLPFTNMSGDPEQAYFADGLAEDLITDLSKVPGLLVIARNSSFAYKGRSVDVRLIASELGVRYVVEGSVRRASTRVRINAQLIDATTGSHLWAERYDRDLADIFVVQDEVVGRIVSALAGTLPATGSLPRRGTTNLEAYDLFARGRWLVFQSLEATRAARPLLRRAVELDPGFAEAHAWLAMSYHFGWSHCGEADENRTLARSAAREAVSLDPENADALIVLGYMRAYEGELAEGVAEIEKGLRINPNHASGWNLLADLRVHEGRAAEAIDCARNYLRIDPRPTGTYYWQLGWAQYALGRYQDAAEALRHEQARGPGVRRILAAALAQLGRMTEAREEARNFLLEYPHFSAKQWGSTQPFRNEADRQHFIDGYVKAGLPE
jgi:TolB-like protein/class 3 adenylate cyclase/tetratricopeptide (TPR) repeat protein